MITGSWLLVFDPKYNNTCTTTTQVIDKKTVKETLDDISQKLDIIRQELQVLETRERGRK